MTEPVGDEAKRLFDEASALVKQQRYQDALNVPVRSSDRAVIARKIADAQAKERA